MLLSECKIHEVSDLLFLQTTMGAFKCMHYAFYVRLSPNQSNMKWYFVNKIFLTYCEKKLFAKFLRSLE